MALLHRSDGDLCAGGRIRKGVVMVQRNAQFAAHIGQFGRVNPPGIARYAHRAEKRNRRDATTRIPAALHQHSAVERRIMRQQIIRTRNQRLHFRPHAGKFRLMRNLRPVDAVDIGENEFGSRRPDQPVPCVADGAVFDNRNRNRTGAAGIVVGGFEVDGDKLHDGPPAESKHRQ